MPEPPPDPLALLAGFDAGQTHCRCRLTPTCGEPTLAEGEGPGVVHLAAPAGPERFRAALRQSLAAARRQLPSDWRTAPLAAAAVGASGIETDSPVQQEGLALAALELDLPPRRLSVTGDERTALEGAFNGGPGLVVISGTGTIAVGSDGRGRLHRCAGWGWLLDDAGSAMDIGRDGLALSLRMADGRVAPTALQERIWAALGLAAGAAGAAGAPQRIKALVVEPEFGAAGFARLAPVVAELAASGDGHAAAILERNAVALAAMAGAVARELKLEAAGICAMGGALEHLEGLRQRFRQALAHQLPQSRLVSPRSDACQGALHLAATLLKRETPVS